MGIWKWITHEGILASQQLVGPQAWDPLFAQSSEEQLVSVIRSTKGYEDRHFAPTLQRLLASSNEPVAESAARALGHPVYSGSETALGNLLASESQRLNYAAVAGLAGIKSQQSVAILLEAEREHPDQRVRRLIDARLGVPE